MSRFGEEIYPLPHLSLSQEAENVMANTFLLNENIKKNFA